jgi:hypothetical protein
VISVHQALAADRWASSATAPAPTRAEADTAAAQVLGLAQQDFDLAVRGTTSQGQSLSQVTGVEALERRPRTFVQAPEPQNPYDRIFGSLRHAALQRDAAAAAAPASATAVVTRAVTTPGATANAAAAVVAAGMVAPALAAPVPVTQPAVPAAPAVTPVAGVEPSGTDGGSTSSDGNGAGGDNADVRE